MIITELEAKSIAEAGAAMPQGKPVVMLNLLKFKLQAEYESGEGLPSCSGQEAYMTRYVPAFAKIAAAMGKDQAFRPVFLGAFLANLVAPAEETWDVAVMVEYDNFDVFRDIVESPEYQREADTHRRASLENWRLLSVLQQPLS